MVLVVGLVVLVLYVVRLVVIFGENERERVKSGGGGMVVNGVGLGVVGLVVEVGRLVSLKDYRNMKLVF